MYIYIIILLVGLVACYYIMEIHMKEGILDNLIFSMTHYGQESRIITKYFIPDHKKIVAIQEHINIFRSHIKEKKIEREKTVQLLEDLAGKEKKLDDNFIDELSEELDKDIDKRKKL